MKDPMAQANKIEAVVFDMDGTLTDSMGYLVECFREAMRAVGEPPAPESKVLSLFGPPDSEVVRKLVPEEMYATALEAYFRYFERNAFRVVPYVGSLDLLRALKRRSRRVGVFTGKGRRTTRVLLGALRLERFFDSVVTGEDVDNPKPAPDGVRLSLKNLGVRAEETLYVGDAPSDVRTARAAGVRVGIALWGDGLRRYRGADFYFSSPGEIETLLDGG